MDTCNHLLSSTLAIFCSLYDSRQVKQLYAFLIKYIIIYVQICFQKTKKMPNYKKNAKRLQQDKYFLKLSKNGGMQLSE